jgi:UDP-N-acetylglucosamine 4,6-dehydratase
VNWQNSSVLITGGTGSFGKRFTEILLKHHAPRKLVIFSRDELKQFEMAQHFPFARHPQLRFFIGDVRDRDRLTRALEGVDIVIYL